MARHHIADRLPRTGRERRGAKRRVPRRHGRQRRRRRRHRCAEHQHRAVRVSGGNGAYIPTARRRYRRDLPDVGRETSRQRRSASAVATQRRGARRRPRHPCGASTTTNIGVSGTGAGRAPATAHHSSRISSHGPSSASIRQAIAAMFAPRVFVSTDGETFVEGSFPALPDGYQIGQIDVSATDNGYVASAQLYDPLAGIGTRQAVHQRRWADLDGVRHAGRAVRHRQRPRRRHDRRLRQRHCTSPQPFTAVSTDGVEWSKMSFSSMLDPATARAPNSTSGWSSAGPGGITAVARHQRRRRSRGRRVLDREGTACA